MKVAVIGAGNVGMDVASEAYLYGAESVIAVDIQKPAAFGKEMEMAVSKGTRILWPKLTERYDNGEKKTKKDRAEIQRRDLYRREKKTSTI